MEYGTVTSQFEAQVLKTPENIAISDGKHNLSYYELNQKSNQVAHWLKRYGIQKNDYVAILLDSSINFFICMLGILKAQATYLPLNSQVPDARINSIINDAKPKLILTNNFFIEKNYLVNWIAVEKLITESKPYPTSNLHSNQNEFDPIYIIYTSGSTGTPKGVIIPHAAIVNVSKVNNIPDINTSSRVGQFCNLSFDLSIGEIWGTLLNGGALVIIPFLAKLDYLKLSEYLNEQNINKMFLPTGYFHQVARLAPDTLNSITTLLICGEKINVMLLREFLQYRKNTNHPIKFINTYGPTEGTVFCTFTCFDETHTYSIDELDTLGLPIKNTRLYVLDDELNKVSNDKDGELYISGVNLALKYHNSDELNEARFIKNPFLNESPLQRLYKTGDIARTLKNGHIKFIGRTDDQIKIRGFRVHLAEIEHCLLAHPFISAVIVTEYKTHVHAQLCAHVILKPQYSEINSEELYHYLLQKLPDYMIPTRINILDKFPLTMNGKVDRQKLIYNINDTIKTENYINLENKTERKISSIWRKLTNRHELDEEKNLFEQGVTSMMLLEAAILLSNEFKQEIDISILLQYPSIAKLAQYLDKQPVTIG